MNIFSQESLAVRMTESKINISERISEARQY